jgi:hypothetical protein
VSKLFRLALDSLLRQRERTAFTIFGLALAIAPADGLHGVAWRDGQALRVSGLIVWVIGLRRAGSVSAEADLAQYAVEEK